jgi:hypothetical protein
VNTSHLYRFLALYRVIGLMLLGTGVAHAFPPAPYYTMYGVVRDQVGQTVTAEGAEVILLKGGGGWPHPHHFQPDRAEL